MTPRNENEVQIFLWDMQKISGKVLMDLTQVLSPSEQTQSEKLKIESERNLWRASRALLRLTLSEYLDPNSDPADWEFERGPTGKPIVKSFTSFEFSISHSHPLITIAFGGKTAVGVDVEVQNSVAEGRSREISRHFFPDKDRDYISAGPETERFLKIWTLMEAHHKALGKALGSAPNGQLPTYSDWLSFGPSQNISVFIQSLSAPRAELSAVALSPGIQFKFHALREPYVKM